jgi:glucokinase
VSTPDATPSPSPGSAVGVGLDVGGTHLRAALVGPDGPVGPILRGRSVTDEASVLVRDVLRQLEELGQGPGGDLPVGLGVAGLVDREGVLRYGPNVGLRDAPLGRMLREALGRPVRVVNDASAAVVGEHRAGAARGHDDVVMLTLGTGVGGGAIVAGELLEGAHGMAAELGHLIIAEDGRDAPSGVDGTVEAYVSGTAIAREARDAVAEGMVGARAIDAPALVAAARDGEPWAHELLATVGRRLGIAIASIVAVLDPALVVIGGGAGEAAAPWLLPAARTAFVAHLMGAAHRPVVDIVPAALGDDAGVIGAALLAADAGR